MTNWIFAFLLSLAVCAGCYPERMTGKFEDMEELGADAKADAVIEESQRDPEYEAKCEQRLREIAAEVEPEYRLNAGDVIEIKVYGHDDLLMSTRISPDGNVGFALVGQMKLADLTIAEGSEMIRDKLSKYIKNPIVSITLKEVHSKTATIAGAVGKPGVFGISNSTRLADLFAMGGASAHRLFMGTEVETADLDKSIVVREGKILPVNFRKAIEQGDPLHNILMRKDDYVYVSQRLDSSVTICGEVKNPHIRPWEAGLGLIEFLAAAGWMLDTHWSHVIIIRDGLANPKMYKVDVDRIVNGGCRNISLKPGDIVYVPKDNMAEYNVFVRKLIPTANVFSLSTSRFSSVQVFD